jgi:nucleoid-associated protein YgaU
VAAAAALLVAALGGAGCGKPVLRIADPSLGDYYSQEEYRRLRDDQREEYCAELARQDSVYRATLADLREAIEGIEERRAAGAAEADSLERLAGALEARLAEARTAAGAQAPGGGAGWPGRATAADGGRDTYTVRAGDCLWRIAAGAQGYGEGRRWRDIYEANRDRVRDPDLVYPGQEIRIPR